MHYVAVLMKFWASLGRRRGIDRDEQWFRQDGATPHTTNDSLAWLRERFKDRLISRKCEIEWVAHSPDLNPPYFYYRIRFVSCNANHLVVHSMQHYMLHMSLKYGMYVVFHCQPCSDAFHETVCATLCHWHPSC